MSGTADIWTRDWAPIQRHDGVFVSYTYRPDYLRGYQGLVTDWRKVTGLPATRKVADSGLILDGGNVVLHEKAAIVTEKVFTENPNLSPARVISRLRDAFHLESLVVIPVEPGDLLGHADGMIAWASSSRVLVNDFRSIQPSLHGEIIRRLRNAGLEPALVPYAPVSSRRSIQPALGVYTNLLILPEVVVIPTYRLVRDDEAVRQIEASFPDCEVLSIDCSAVAREGGAIRCVTGQALTAR